MTGVELIAISGFIVAILSGISQCIKKSNLNKFKLCCCYSECIDKDINMEAKMKQLTEKIEKNEKKIHKNKTKLDVLKNKKRESIIPDIELITDSINNFEEITEI